MRRKLYIIFFVFVLILLSLTFFFYNAFLVNKTNDSVNLDEESYSLSFDTKELDCENIYTPETDLYFVGSTVIDVDNDGVDEFYITTGNGKKDCLYSYINGDFVNIIDQIGIDSTQKSYGVFSIDITDNGYTDLVIARKNGLYLYKNNKGIFTETLIYDQFEHKSIPVDISLTDYDNDGDIDMYISTFADAEFFKITTFNNPANRQRNIFLENIGNETFIDVTDAVGLTFSQNTFLSAFVDLNNDNLEDLVLGNNTDKIFIYENNGDGFTLRANPSGYGFWMGMSISDYNGDGLVDLFLSNSGDTIPERFLLGDLKEDQPLEKNYTFLRNDGNFTFTNVLLDIVEIPMPFGWGIVANDFNFDNKDDYLVMHNYIKWTPHKLSKSPGALFLNINNKLEQVINTSGLANDNFGFSSLIGDFNNDNLKDVVYINIASPHILHINTSKTTKDSFTVDFANKAKYINVVTELVFADKDKIVKRLHRKQGIQSTQDSSIIFYYQNKKPKKVNVLASSGEVLESFDISKDQTNLFIGNK